MITDNRKKLMKRLFMTLTGVLVCSFSVGMFNLAAFGVDPFQCFAQGAHLPVSHRLQYGTFYMGISLIMLAVIWFWERRYVGMATFINLFFTGYVVDYSYRLLLFLLPEATLIQRALMLAAAVIIMCFGSALYYTADLGVSVYDAISLILADRRITLARRVLPFKWIRVFNDFVCVALGTLFGKMPGAGTIITAFFMGPLISFFIDKIARPFLRGKEGEAIQHSS